MSWMNNVRVNPSNQLLGIMRASFKKFGIHTLEAGTVFMISAASFKGAVLTAPFGDGSTTKNGGRPPLDCSETEWNVDSN